MSKIQENAVSVVRGLVALDDRNEAKAMERDAFAYLIVTTLLTFLEKEKRRLKDEILSSLTPRSKKALASSIESVRDAEIPMIVPLWGNKNVFAQAEVKNGSQYLDTGILRQELKKAGVSELILHDAYRKAYRRRDPSVTIKILDKAEG